jgi:hypothetical protein
MMEIVLLAITAALAFCPRDKRKRERYYNGVWFYR